jgi:hypothetical protein
MVGVEVEVMVGVEIKGSPGGTHSKLKLAAKPRKLKL